jgi:hypothetical protein
MTRLCLHGLTSIAGVYRERNRLCFEFSVKDEQRSDREEVERGEESGVGSRCQGAAPPSSAGIEDATLRPQLVTGVVVVETYSVQRVGRVGERRSSRRCPSSSNQNRRALGSVDGPCGVPVGRRAGARISGNLAGVVWGPSRL